MRFPAFGLERMRKSPNAPRMITLKGGRRHALKACFKVQLMTVCYLD
jgi:hypothetical protein